MTHIIDKIIDLRFFNNDFVRPFIEQLVKVLGFVQTQRRPKMGASINCGHKHYLRHTLCQCSLSSTGSTMAHSLTEPITSLYKAKGTSRGNESLTLVEYSDLVELNDCPEGGTVVQEGSRVAHGAAPSVGLFRL